MGPAQEHNTVRLELEAPLSQVKHSTTVLPMAMKLGYLILHIFMYIY